MAMLKLVYFFSSIKKNMDMIGDDVWYQELIGEFQFRLRISIQIA